MKILYFIFVIALISSCSEVKQKEENKKAILSGTITNPVSDFIVFKKHDNTIDTLSIDDKGVFTHTLEVDESEYVSLTHNETKLDLFLTSGDSINIAFDAANFDNTISFSGANSTENQYLFKKGKLKEDFNEKHQPIYQYYSLNPAHFILKLDTIYQPLDALFTNFVSNNKLNDSFQFIEEQTLKYDKAIDRLIYAASFNYIERDSLVKLPEDYDSYLEETDFNEERLAKNKVYQEFLKNRIDILTEEVYMSDSTNFEDDAAYYTIQLKSIFENIESPKVLEEILLLTTTDKLRMDKEGINDSTFMMLEKHISDSDKMAELKELYEDWDRIAEGKEAPAIAAEDIDGEIHALSDFLGSYVYIDTWATWCGPCKAELPYLEKLQEEYKDENIVFLSISIDRNHDSWKKMVTDKSMKGVQWIARDEMQKQLTENYKIASIPRFILIDKEGFIIDSNAPRPSGDIAAVLDGLLAD